MNELDEIMSGASDAASANTAETTTTTVEAPASEAAGQPRDETGRFASHQSGQSEAPAATTEPNAAEHQEPGKGVPVAALQAEREKARTARDEAEALRREIAELRGMVTAQRQPASAQPAAEAAPATIWDNPDGYVDSRLTPIQQQLMDQREFLSETLAVQAHGAEAVDAAKKAIEQVAATPEGQQIIRKMMQSRHPFNDLVSWHKQQAAIQRVGNDPDAWLEAEMEKRLSDPTYQAQILERIRGSAAQNTSRTQPVTSLPPSLSRMPGGANAAADNDMSDGSLFSHATR